MACCQAFIFVLVISVPYVIGSPSYGPDTLWTMTEANGSTECYAITEAHGYVRSHANFSISDFHPDRNHALCLTAPAEAETITLKFLAFVIGSNVNTTLDGCKHTHIASSVNNRFFIYNGAHRDGNPRRIFQCAGAKIIGDNVTWGPRELKSRNISFQLYTAEQGNKGVFIEYELLNANLTEVSPVRLCAESTTFQPTSTGVTLSPDVIDNNDESKQNNSAVSNCQEDKREGKELAWDEYTFAATIGTLAGVILSIMVSVGFHTAILRIQARNQTQLLNAVSTTTSDKQTRLRGQETVHFSTPVNCDDEDEETPLHDSSKIAIPNDQDVETGLIESRL